MELYKSKNWTIVYVDWCQEFVGDCIISCDKEQLSDLTDEDWQELGRLEKELERVCKKLFNAYRDNEKPHVHFHFIPRYKEKVDLFGKIYNDKHFGYNFWKWALSRFKSQKDIFTKDERIKIYEMMKEEFKYE